MLTRRHTPIIVFSRALPFLGFRLTFVIKRMKLKPNLRLQLAGAEEGEVIGCDEEMIDIQQAKHAAKSEGGIYKLTPRGE
jgi:hypothetical protein